MRPLACLALAFCFGICCAELIYVPFYPLYALSLFVAVFLAVLSRRSACFGIALLCLSFLMGGLSLRNSHLAPGRDIARAVPCSYRGEPEYLCEGFVCGLPLQRGREVVFPFEITSVSAGRLRYECSGKVLVRARAGLTRSYGEALFIRGTLRRHRYQGFCRALKAKVILKADVAPRKKPLWLASKERIEELLRRRTSQATAAVLGAMILGERGRMSAVISNEMMKCGTVHILVVSGFNVGLVCGLITIVLRLLRVGRPPRFLIICPLLVFYALITGASTPVVRATIMAIAFMAASFIKREPDMYNSCALAAFFILARRPQDLFDTGFQLSFASVLAIVVFYPRLKRLLLPECLKIRGIRFIAEGFLVSLSAWLGTAGLVAWHFKIFSPVTAIANILVVPLASLITLSGFSLALAEFAARGLACYFAAAAELQVWLLLAVNRILARLPGAYFHLP